MSDNLSKDGYDLKRPKIIKFVCQDKNAMTISKMLSPLGFIPSHQSLEHGK
jgi:hypothetical protein